MKLAGDIKNLANARIVSYREHIRPKDNEWIIEELIEWAEDVHRVATLSRERELITREQYNAIVSAAIEPVGVLGAEIKEYERVHEVRASD